MFLVFYLFTSISFNPQVDVEEARGDEAEAERGNRSRSAQIETASSRERAAKAAPLATLLIGNI